jgi:hypothetical protein
MKISGLWLSFLNSNNTTIKKTISYLAKGLGYTYNDLIKYFTLLKNDRHWANALNQ